MHKNQEKATSNYCYRQSSCLKHSAHSTTICYKSSLFQYFACYLL